MGGIFNMDGAFFKFGNAIADIMLLSLFWILFSIPLITIGASTTALFYVTTRRISDKEGYLFRDFYSSFKSNFKIATSAWLLVSFLMGVVIANIYMLSNFDFEPMLSTILLPIQVVILIELVITTLYLFPLISRFEMSFLQTIKSAFFMANRHMLTTISCVSIGVLIVLASAFLFEPILIIGMGLYAYGTSYMFMQIFKKYRPEIDADNLSGELEPILDISTDIPADIPANISTDISANIPTEKQSDNEGE